MKTVPRKLAEISHVVAKKIVQGEVRLRKRSKENVEGRKPRIEELG
tara:strand:+ start:879 stop:1016 length:138 start_codon:yes stop_codon:yes gene_type:complete